MAILNSGLGGGAGYGENVFSSSTKFSGDNDDGAVQIDVTSVFGNGITLFGETYTDLYINSNGAITFGSASTSYNNSGLSDFTNPALLPFYSDININSGGEIYWDIDPSNGQITITWDSVAPYSGSGANSFQVVLSDLGGGEMGVEYTYGDIQWAHIGGTGASAGLTNGDAADFELEFSGNSASMLGYETNDFDNGDPAGTFSFVTSGGIPDILLVSGSSANDTLGVGFADAQGNEITESGDAIDAGAGADSVDGGGGDDTILGGAGNDTIVSGSGGTGPISWTAFNAGANLHGTTGQDFWQYNGGEGTSATVRFNNSASAGDGDGLADYLHVTSTGNNISLTVGDFDPGVDKIVLSDNFSVTSVTTGAGLVDLTVTLNNGNQQFFTLYHDSGTIDPNTVFTTTLPTTTTVADDDLLVGGDDADTFLLEDSFGADTLIGGEGGTDSDQIDATGLTRGVNVTLTADEMGTLSSGGDTLNFSEIESFELTAQEDTLTAVGVTKGITVDGNAGNDQLTGGSGGDTLTGGTGNDQITGDNATTYEVSALRLGVDYTINSGDLDNGGFGSTLSVASTGTVTLIAQDGVIRGDPSNEMFTETGQGIVVDGVIYNVLYDDLIAYSDDVTGDTYTFAAIDVDLNSDGTAGTGEDGYYLIQVAGPDVPNGADLTFSSLVSNNPPPLDLTGFEVGGDDSLDGGEGQDAILGGIGNDTINDGGGDDTVYGGDGDDIITQTNADGGGDDLLFGEGGDDTIDISNGQDTAFGGDGSDTFISLGSARDKTVVGGEGGADHDVLSWAGESDAADAVSVTFSSNEAGSAIIRSQTVTFSEIEEIEGTQANDTFDATVTTVGTALHGLGGSDTITGGSGNDSIDGGAGADLLSGGSGNDSFGYAVGGDTMFGGAGDDTMHGGFTAGVDDAELHGGDGNDNIVTYGANDTVFGDAGADLIAGDWGDEYLDGGADDDTIYGGAGNDTIVGGTREDYLDGAADADTFIIEDNFGNDTIIGGEGGTDSDNIDFSGVTSGLTITHVPGIWSFATDGTDTVSFTEIEKITLTGAADSADMLYSDVVNIDGGGGADTLAGSDFAGAGDTLSGGGGDDSLLGNGGNDTLLGGADNDILDGGTANDVLDGGVGDDTLLAGFGADSFVGGDGNDVLQIDGSAVEGFSFDINLATGTDAYGNTYSGIETIIGGDAGDILTGDSADNRLEGRDGADTFNALDGFGNDTIIGGEGGTDSDLVEVSALTTGVTVNFSGNEAGTITNGADTITFSQIERLVTTDLSDTIEARDDALGFTADLGAGNDTIDLGGGNYTIEGGSGQDSIDVDDFWFTDGLGITATITNAGGTIDGGDNSVVSTGFESYALTYGADFFDASATTIGINIFGRDGEYSGWGGADTLIGGSGNDTISHSDGFASLTGGAGNDYISSINGDKVILFADGFGNDTLDASTGEDIVDFSTLTTQSVSVTMTSGTDGTATSGTDSVLFDSVSTAAFNSFLLSVNSDSFNASSSGAAFNVSGNDGNDTLIGGTGADTLAGGDGDDYIDGGDGDDVLTTGLGQDTLVGGLGNDTLMNSDGDDVLIGGAGDDSIVATGGADTLRGGTGDDYMDGGNDADTFIIEDSFGNDTIIGGEGTTDGTDVDSDNIDLSMMTGPVTVTYTGAEAGTITDGTDTITFSEIENLILTDQNDSVSAGANGTMNVDLGDGDDTVSSNYGHASDDMIIGGGGNDDIQAGGGSDYIDGGTGNDYLTTGGGGSDTVYAGEGDDTIASWFVDGDAEIYGEDGNDVIYGSSMADTLDGGAGNDYIDGGGGADTILGQGGNDDLDGGNDAETIDGGTGDDTIDGNRGDDSLTGGDGNDTFIYNPNDGTDTITDFNSGNTGTLDDGDSANNDFINLSGYYDHISELYADQADDGILNQSNTTSTRGEAVDYSDNSQFGSGSIEMQGASADAGSFTQENTGVVCFARGTAILTPRGEVLIENLRAGDLIITRDNGPRPLLMLAHRSLGPADLIASPKLRPILIKGGLPGQTAPLTVSPQHGMLLKMNGTETLVRAKHLVQAEGMKARVKMGCRHVTYIHLIFEGHQIVFANGAASESLFPGKMALGALTVQVRQDLFRMLPQLKKEATGTGVPPWVPARSYLKRRELIEMQARPEIVFAD